MASGCARQDKTISGIVVDCETGKSLTDVEVSVNQRGWGFDKYLVWDKDYVYRTRSNESGYFEITYQVGSSAHLIARKDGYLRADKYEYPQDGVTVRMLQGDAPAEVTYDCKGLSECLKTTVEDGVQVTRNVCL